MKVGKSVQKAIDEWESGDLESAMLHACNAIDGTAKKRYPNIAGSQRRFTKLLRDSYSILGPMGMPGIDVAETRFPIEVRKATAIGGQPDLADVIYCIHRCTHGHGDELPEGFELIRDVSGPARLTHVVVSKGKIRLSDRMIFGLLAVAVLSPSNIGQAVPAGHYLTFGASHVLMINEWWGRADDFATIAATDPTPSVKLDFGDWMY
jgi:hypothetical protein